jgi:nucleotide-binding universal stress UspA family protein
MNTLHTAELGFRRALVPLDGSMVAATPLFEWLQVLTAVRSGEAPQEIIAAARELTAGVIAMTTHGRTGLKRLLFGSVPKPCCAWPTFQVFMVRASHLEAAMRVA